MSNNNNDIEALLAYADGIDRNDLVMKICFGSQSLQDTKDLVAHFGRPLINIGDGLTLLHQAASNNNPEIVDFLCSEGHPLEYKTSAGETPLDQAAWKGSWEAAQYLVKHGADVDSQTNNGYTPMHRCAFYNHKQFACFLQLAGANLSLKDTNGETAYDVALKHNPDLAKNCDPNSIMVGVYERNNPKHPEYKPESREGLWQLFLINEASKQK